MKRAILWISIVLCLPGFFAHAQQSGWRQQMEEARRAATNAEATVVVLRSGHDLGPDWPAGAYGFHNNPRPFCYAYVIPGDWYPGTPGVFRSKDGRSLVGLTFLPSPQLERMAGGNPIERARNAAVEKLERDLRQPMGRVELLPFSSSRPGTWRLKADAIRARDGQSMPFPLYVLVDLSPHGVAEVNVFGTQDDERMARSIVEKLRISSDPECYLADLERMYRAWYPEQAKFEYLKEDPPKGTLQYGEIVYVADGSCPAGEIREVTGGRASLSIPRAIRCVKLPGQPRAGDVSLVGQYHKDKDHLFPDGRDQTREALYLRALTEGAAGALYKPAPRFSAEENLAVEYDAASFLARTFGKNHWSHGIVLGKVGRWKEAADALGRAVKGDPSHAGTWGNLGVANHALGRFRESVEAFERAVALDQTYFTSREAQRQVWQASRGAQLVRP